ncbi:uncharacterized protein B0T15DRAFT_102625 [Chaetomium strumarium]|uniref:Secreted protein n=1 Tax=Chaetomium strumarium TaxID=1170767 RepID=A0AAJ0GY13_9PEZI|nr:hypothetical protein B0T15DRAFT_102625 [Chaetomium strumarium]
MAMRHDMQLLYASATAMISLLVPLCKASRARGGIIPTDVQPDHLRSPVGWGVGNSGTIGSHCSTRDAQGQWDEVSENETTKTDSLHATCGVLFAPRYLSAVPETFESPVVVRLLNIPHGMIFSWCSGVAGATEHRRQR